MKRLAGFTLIEVIIAGALVATTAGALFAVSSMALRFTTLGQDRLVAGQLAREGIEIARQIRNSNLVSSQCPTSEPCSSWSQGLITSGELLPALKHVEAKAQTGFELTTLAVSQETSCSDYIERDLKTGTLTTFASKPDLSSQTQLFCRRIVIEQAQSDSAHTELTTALTQPEHALRIRSQVAWLGNGRGKFRIFDSLQASNPCELSSSTDEWCSEEVTLLTDWRPQL